MAASIYNASADQVVMGNGSGGYVSFALSVSGATTTSGVLNGLDTGMITAGWYNVFAVSNGSVSGVVLSLNASAPAAGILANYPYYARIGALRYGVSGFLGTIQKGRRVRYVMGGANLASAMPTMASGVAGNVTTPTWVAIATGAFVPPTASSIFILPATAAAGVMLVAPNVSYGTYRIATAPPPYQFDSNSTSASVFELGLESANIYWASTSASLAVLCYGWEDNI